ncbi:hypothetical protein N9189_01515 [Pirellulaceae bacterium]|jgi:hypothetical protein|nr:hypothetical protein [Pirellulaceae bacterium]
MKETLHNAENRRLIIKSDHEALAHAPKSPLRQTVASMSWESATKPNANGV